MKNCLPFRDLILKLLKSGIGLKSIISAFNKGLQDKSSNGENIKSPSNTTDIPVLNLEDRPTRPGPITATDISISDDRNDLLNQVGLYAFL